MFNYEENRRKEEKITQELKTLVDRTLVKDDGEKEPIQDE